MAELIYQQQLKDQEQKMFLLSKRKISKSENQQEDIEGQIEET